LVSKVGSVDCSIWDYELLCVFKFHSTVVVVFGTMDCCCNI